MRFSVAFLAHPLVHALLELTVRTIYRGQQRVANVISCQVRLPQISGCIEHRIYVIPHSLLLVLLS